MKRDPRLVMGASLTEGPAQQEVLLTSGAEAVSYGESLLHCSQTTWHANASPMAARLKSEGAGH